MRIYKIAQNKTAQDFGGYFEGEVPESAVDMLGSSSIDARQIQSMFGRTNDAMSLVNEFNGGLLSGISYIFNFTKGGAYGVYVSELDRAIKTKALQRELESQGYRIEVDDNGLLKAYPTKEEKKQDDIQRDIDKTYQQLESEGGTALGINMGAVINAAKMDAEESDSPDPSIWEWMAILHLGGTIVHETIHSKGDKNESGPQAAENAFIQWALPKVNEEYRKQWETTADPEEEFTPISMGTEMRHAISGGWYKKAQFSNYMPNGTGANKPRGSDLSGRAGAFTADTGRADWGMMMQQDQNVAIEEKLDRRYMSPLPPDLIPEHETLEEQLRKYTRGYDPLDENAITEELLSEDHDDSDSYKTLEELLEETRPSPLLVPLQKAASIHMQKKATLFGWMNNLDLSDGSTIPGLSDRVMAWDDRDESFSEEESWIKQQPRYNPTYDIKGFYYRYIEPRFAPQLWNDMMNDHSNTHPAKRFASKREEFDPDFVKILSILGQIKSKILKGSLKATRIMISDDLLPLVENVLEGHKININVFELGDINEKETIYSVWMSSAEIYPENIEKIEKYVQNKDINVDIDKLMDEVFDISNRRRKVIDEVLEAARNICKEYGIKDLYVVGGYPRTIAMHNKVSEINDLDFSAAWPSQSLKVGGLLAEKLGVNNVKTLHRTQTISFTYKDLKLDFKGNFSPVQIREKMREHGLRSTPLNMDVYNRDFTMNMLVYDILSNKIYDVVSRSKQDIDEKVIRTIFDPNFIVKQNPLIILRALKFKVRYGFDIAPELEMAMIENVPLLFDGSLTDARLMLEREKIVKEGSKEAEKLFEEFGLERLKEL